MQQSRCPFEATGWKEKRSLSLQTHVSHANQLLAYTNKRARDMTEGHTQVERAKGGASSEERATGSAQAERRLCAGG